MEGDGDGDGDGDGEGSTPFWVQSTANFRRGERLRRGVAAVFFSSGLVVFLLLVTAVIFLVFVVPSTISFSANVFRPNSVKKSWDSLNIVLVLVAVVFGFLSRSINEERDEFQPSISNVVKENHEAQKSNPSTPNKWFNNFETKSNLSTNQWYEFQYYDHQPKLEQKNSILRRSSSSYPDLREFPSSSSSNWNYGDYERRFFDDFHVDSSRSSDPSQLHHRRHRSLEQVDYLASPPQTKTVIVDTLVSKSAEALKFLAALSSPSLSPAATEAAEDEEVAKKVVNESEVVRKERSSRRFYKDMEILNPVAAPKPPLPPAEESSPPEFQESQVRSRERGSRKKERLSRRQSRDMEVMNPIATPPSHTPPPPPPPPPPEQKSSKSERRKGGATGSSTKDFLNSLYNNKKKKKQRQRSVDNMDSLLHEAQPPLSFQIPPPSPPPPPPPLPPPSVFHTLFSSKKPKRKRTITVTLEPLPTSPPPAPPPPPPPHAAARDPEHTSQPAHNHKPPKPVKMNKFDRLDEASNSGGESPLSRIPPPPPPPPPSLLKNPAWKFVVQGDYVRVNSNDSSRSGSPDLDEADSDVTPSASDGGEATAFHPSPLFCASPDVNSKAESFITNFRAKLKLEKISSMKKRDVGPSSLGPGPGPIQN